MKIKNLINKNKEIVVSNKVKPASFKKDVLFNKLINYNFNSLLTLIYPMDIYPIKEKSIKEHLNSFIEKLRNQSRKTNILYIYVYELQQNNTIQIHILNTITDNKKLLKLKTAWIKIIGTEKEEYFIFKEISSEELLKYCEFILKVVNPNIDRNVLFEKLGVNSRLLGGSIELQSLFKDLKVSLLPIIYEEPINSKPLENILNLLKKEYPQVSSDILEEEIALELQNYSDAYSLIHYQDIEEFLKKSKSKTSKGYLKFYNFIQDLTNNIIYKFKILLKTWYEKKERKHLKLKILNEALELDKDIPHENYRLLISAGLDYIFKSSIRGINLLIIIHQLGKLILSDEIIIKLKSVEIITEEPTEKLYREIGMLFFMIIKNLLKNILDFDLSLSNIEEQRNTDTDDFFDFLLGEDEMLASIVQTNQTIEFNYDSKSLEKLKNKKPITKELITQHLLLTHPMIIKPKNWSVLSNSNTKIIEKGLTFYDTGKLVNGGYLLNNYYFKKSLQKNINGGHLHKLAVSESCLNTVNKIQEIPFIVNKELLNLLIKNKRNITDYKTGDELKNLIALKKEKIQLKKKLYIEKRTLIQLNANLGPINEKLQSANAIIEDCTSKLTKNDLLQRLLINFSNLEKYPNFYYSYDLDFRMRIYPQQIELSPQGSKLSRSLIKFKEKFEFNLLEFMLYTTRLYKKIYEFTEPELIIIYKNEIEPIFQKFIINEESIIKEIFEKAAEPYLFLAACIEYKNYKEAESKEEKYYTGYPIILDCSGSGPQIISLLFLMEDFANFLNLKPNEERKDFYIAVIKKFLQETNIKNKYFKSDELLNSQFPLEENQELYIILRRCCKTVIMTQIYGVSYLKVTKTLYKNLKDNEKKLVKFLQENINYDTFIHEFTTSFWDYLRQLPLFKLRGFFQVIINNLSKADKELSWTILSNSKVSVNYQKQEIHRLDFKDSILGRIQLNQKQMINKKNFSKMKTSAQANFIHSIDAAINMYILEKHTKSIFPIHDAWGIGMGQSTELLNSIKEIYYQLSIDNIILKTLIQDFTNVLSETISLEAGELFKNYCENKLILGNYDPKNLLLCKYMVYYG